MKVASSLPTSGQRGFVLILVVLTMMLILGTVLLVGVAGSTNQNAVVIGKNISSDQKLALYRDALIGVAVGFVSSTSRPGILPTPDTNYDGQSELSSCLDGTNPNGTTVLANAAAQSPNLRCLGKLPWKTIGIAIESVDASDVTGIVPWYAVSENLTKVTTCMQFLNPGTVTGATTIFSCPATTGPAWPWLKVCDSTGRILSDRVAVVLIMPGPPLVTTGRAQSRASSPSLPIPGDYLDAIPTPAGWSALPAAQRCSTFDNAGLTGEFILADQSNTFNDRLTYITVDELFEKVELRVANEVREALIRYKNASVTATAPLGSYPWMAPVGNPVTPTTSTLAQPGLAAGLIPFSTYSTPLASEQKFLTEADWDLQLSTGGDAISAAVTANVRFLCYGGAYQCRLRTLALANPSSAATVFNAPGLRTSSLTTPSLKCSYSFNAPVKQLNCDLHTNPPQLTTVSYVVQRRPCCTGGYTTVGTYTGTQTRTVTLNFTNVVQSSVVPFLDASASATVRRTIKTNSSFAQSAMVDVSDQWTPSVIGVAPFDSAGGPWTTGTATTGGNGVATISKVRVLPELPSWYFNEKWYEYMYAAISPDSVPTTGNSATCSVNCLVAGVRMGLDVVVISAGSMLAGQARYSASPNVTDFLEGNNATGATTKIFASPDQKHSSTYADTVTTIPR